MSSELNSQPNDYSLNRSAFLESGSHNERASCDLTAISCVAFSLYQEFEKQVALDPQRPISKVAASHLDALIETVHRVLAADEYLSIATAGHVPGACMPVQDASLHVGQIGKAIGRAYARARSTHQVGAAPTAVVHGKPAPDAGDSDYQLWLAASTG
jgi:hypothetical protein